MKTENKFTDWYELWMKQSQDFFTTANKNLKDLFEKNGFVKPEEHADQINQWLENLKKQWETFQVSHEQQAYQSYWKMMTQLSDDAFNLMMQQWKKRNEESKPIKNIQELYELWLNCCREVYQKSLQAHSVQEAYTDFMNSAVKFWTAAMNKK